MRSKLMTIVLVLNIISFILLIITSILSAKFFNNLLGPQLFVFLFGIFVVMYIFIFIGIFVLPILSIIAIYKTYKNKLEGRWIAIGSLVLSLINLGIVLTIITNFNKYGFFT